MIHWLLRRQLDAFEQEYNYDMGYAREMLSTSARALLRFSKVMGMAQYHEDIPLEAWYAAKLVATLSEDCGPCTQLVADMAIREGVSPRAIRSVLAREDSSMSRDVSLAFRFANATLRHDPTANELRLEIIHLWGRKALVSLAFGITSARIFPTLKYALGHGHTCSRVRIDGVDEVPAAAR